MGQLVLRVANLLLGVAVTVFLVRGLGDQGFGQWSTLLAVTTLAGFLGDLGLSRVAVERAAAQPAQQAVWVGSLITLRLALALPTAAGAAMVCLLLADGADMRVAGVLLCAILLFAGLSSARVIFQLQVRNTINTAIEIGNGIAWGAVVIVAVLVGEDGLVTLAAGFAIVGVITECTYFLVARRAAPIAIRGSRKRWGQLLRLGIPVGVGGLLVLGYGYIDQVLVFRISGAQDAGYYGAVYRIFDRVQFLPAVLMTTLFPIIVAARHADPARVRRLFHMAIDYLVMASLPALTITLAGPEALVRLAFGAEFAPAAPALPVLMATFLVVSLGYLSGYLILAYELQRRFIVFALAALVFNVSANLLLLPSYGFMAAAWITLATEILVVGLALHAVCRRMEIRPTGRHLDRIVIAAVAAGLVGWLLRQGGVPTGVWAALACAIYPAFLVGLRVVDLGELRALRRREDPV